MRHNGPYPTPIEERFWAKVQKSDGCWAWTGARHSFGYGYLYRGSETCRPRMIGAHRLSWQIHNGPIPGGLAVLHRCDNPPCVNPAHLFLGTKADNNLDRARKGRSPRAFPPDQVAQMAALREEGLTYRQVAARLGLRHTSVHRALNSRRWMRETA